MHKPSGPSRRAKDIVWEGNLVTEATETYTTQKYQQAEQVQAGRSTGTKDNDKNRRCFSTATSFMEHSLNIEIIPNKVKFQDKE